MPALDYAGLDDIRLEVRLLTQLLKLGGDPDYIDVGDVGAIEGNAFTIEAWVKVPNGDPPTDVPSIYSEGDPTAWTSSLLILYAGGDGAGGEAVGGARVYLKDNAGTGGTLLLGTSDLRGAWHHVVVRQASKSSRELLVDLQSEDTDTTTLGAIGVTDAYIGAADSNGTITQFAHAGTVIREVRVWNDYRTDAELRATYEAALSGAEAGLIGYWKVDEGSGTTIADDAGSNDGTLTGGSWLTGPGPLWTDIWDDVLEQDPTTFSYGAQDLDPRSRAAVGGTAQFTLDNDGQSNSAGLDGYYSLGHANALDGWTEDLEIRLTLERSGSDPYRKWRGWIQTIKPSAGRYYRKVVQVTAGDWFAWASEIKPRGLDVLESATGDEILEAMLSAISKKPDRFDLDVGKSTFDYALDEVRDGNTTAFMIANNVALSELGRVYQAGDQVNGGVLRFENRHARVLETSVLATLDQDFESMEVEGDMGLVYTVVRSQANPREVDTNPTQTLYSLDTDPLEIAGEATEEFEGKYSDPNNRDARIAGIDMTDPEGYNELKQDAGATRDFEDGVTGWSASLSTIAQSNEEAKKGNYSMKITADAGSVFPLAYVKLSSGYAEGDVIQAQIYLKTPDALPGDLVLLIQERDSGGGWLRNTIIDSYPAASTPTAGWVRLCAELTLGANVDYVIMFVGSDNATYAGGEIIFADEAYLIRQENLNYEFSSTMAGGGDLNTVLELIDSEIGGNAASYVAHNTGSAIGYLTISAVGKRVLVYQPQTASAEVDEDADGQEYPTDRTLSLILPYLTSVLEAQDFSDILLSRHKSRKLRVQSVTFYPNRSSSLLNTFLQAEPGTRVTLKDDPTGINGDYFLNGVEFQIMADDKLKATWYVEEAGESSYWLIGETGASEIGETTIAGF